MPYHKKTIKEDYWERTEQLKSWEVWAERKREYLKRILGKQFYAWLDKQAPDVNDKKPDKERT